MNITRIPYRYLLVFAVAALSCSMQSLTGGSDMPNGITVTGTVFSEDGTGSPETEVRLIPAEYDPFRDKPLPRECIAQTDTSGRYLLRSSDTGLFNILAVRSNRSTSALLLAVPVTGDSAKAPRATLQKTGAIKVTLPDGIYDDNGYLYIPGTTISAAIADAGGIVTIGSVPAGKIPGINYRQRVESDDLQKIADSVWVFAGGTFTVAYGGWNFSKRIFLNTTASGADVRSSVTGFPVLVRLWDGNFSFNEARPDGADLRFAKSNGIPLPCEIERWDSSSKRAEIWVMADTVYGDNDSQYLLMFWGGDSSASGNSDGRAVFDTADGFVGVWHMNEAPPGGVASFKDRTVNGHHATSYGSMTAANSVDGTVGKGLRFNGRDDYLNAGNVSVSGNYSIGLWAQLNTIDDYERFIFKDSSYTLWYDKDSVSVRMEHMSTTTRWKGLLQDGGTRVPMTTGAWYFLMATFDGTVIRLYKDGSEVSVSNPITVSPRTNTKPLVFGKANAGPFVNGIMDEIRIEGTVRSADWVRLCYMNQRTDDKLIIFK